MLNTVKLYYFSPTGGTKKIGLHFAENVGAEVAAIDLGRSKAEIDDGEIAGAEIVGAEQASGFDGDAELTVVAMPVFAGRIPGIIKDRLPQSGGEGKKAVTLAVYGNRAYEDALLELNDAMEERGFAVIASGAFVAQHSIAPEIASGRPDQEDLSEIAGFAEAVAAKLADMQAGSSVTSGSSVSLGSSVTLESSVSSATSGSSASSVTLGSSETLASSVSSVTLGSSASSASSVTSVKVPGNRPYRPAGGGPNVIEVSSRCSACGLCASVCPTGAASLGENFAATDSETCIECMACIAACPVKARSLPQEVRSRVEQFLAPLKDVRSKNEMFL